MPALKVKLQKNLQIEKLRKDELITIVVVV